MDWAIEDGYYLYRKELAFESNTKAVVLGKARLPAGQSHEDEYFGKQQVYREHFYVTVPYRIEGNRPETMELVIKSRGCWDGGLCYPPQTWTETVALKKTGNSKLDLESVGGPSTSSNLGGFPPPEEVFFPDLFAIDGNTVEVGIRVIPAGYKYYSNRSPIT